MRIAARVAGLLILFAAVVVSVLVAAPRTAHAHYCGDTELSDYAHEVDVAFVGRKIPLAFFADQLDRESRRFIEFVTVFRVERIYKGQVGAIEGVHSTPGLGYDPHFESGSNVVVAFGDPDGSRWVSRCYDATIAELEEEFGPGYPPPELVVQQAPAESPSTTAEPASDDAPTVSPPQPETPPEPASDSIAPVDPRQPPDDDSPRLDALVVALIPLGAAAVLIGSALALRRRRHRPPPAG